MSWVVDTSVVLDLVTGDPDFEPASSACLHAHLLDGLVVSPITFVELGPTFSGDALAAERFLQHISIGSSEFWMPEVSHLAHRLWHQHHIRRKQSGAVKRPAADVLIAAFASRFQGLITRNARDFRNIAPQLTLVEP